MGTSVLHIKTEVECRVYLFDEEKGIAKPGTYFNLEVRKGEQDLLFVSTENESLRLQLQYNVEENDYDYRIMLKRSQYYNNIQSSSQMECSEISIAVATDEEIKEGIIDECGVIYSRDGKHLLRCYENIQHYRVKDGCKVIRSEAFCSCTELSSVFLPQGLTHIGKSAFSICFNLSNINLPEGLTHIGDAAFSQSSLVSIKLPNSVTSIGANVFVECKNLSSVTFPQGLTDIGECAFKDCESLESVLFPNSLVQIGDHAFCWCKNLTSVALPENLLRIENGAFYGCVKLPNIVLPKSITYIGDSSFGWCESLNSIVLPPQLSHIGERIFVHTNIRSVISHSQNYLYDNGYLIDVQEKRLIAFLSRKEKVILPNGITHIGSGTFEGNEDLISITLPEGLTHIGDDAFSNCKNLINIDIPSSLVYIGSNAFSGCESLLSIHFPDGLINIGSSAFYGCKGLSDLTLPCSLTHIGDSAFFDCESLLHIKIPNTITCIEACMFRECDNLSSVILPESLTFIGDSAFEYCEKLSNIILPKRLACIGNMAFHGCSSMRNVTFPFNLEHIGSHAFWGCENLTAITLPDNLKQIGESAFQECERLFAVDLPDSLTNVGYMAFSWCYNLSQINIPCGMRMRFEAILPKELHDLIKEKKQVDDITRNIRCGGVPDLIKEKKQVDDTTRNIRCGGIPDLIKEIKLVDNTTIIKPSYYLFFDTETTGVPRDYKASASNTRNWPRLVQLGWIVTDEEGNVLSQGNEIVKPEGFVIPADAARVHGITTERAQREGKPLREVIETFLKDAEQTKCIVGHNISFDQKVVGAELYRLGIPDTISTVKSLCTMQAGTDYCKIPGYYGYKWPKLQELYHKLFGCDFEDAHDAMADITATKKCFFEMRKRGLI